MEYIKQFKEKKVLLVAPHPDDEVIGAWTLLKQRLIDTVAYVYYNDIRKREAENSSKKYGFKAIFLDDFNTLEKILSLYDIVLVPHPMDHHPHHKQTTYVVESYVDESTKVMYYSTDMNVWWAIKPVENPHEKRSDLLELYPSQAEDIMVNRYWWLFEGITEFPGLPIVEVKTHFLGYHRWSNAPPGREYLRYTHQHEFEAIVRIGVYGLDRYVEFHWLREIINDYLNSKRNYGDMSVEMIARELYYYLRKRVGVVPIRVKICEEGGLCGEYGEQI